MATTPSTRTSEEKVRFSETLSRLLHRGRFVFWTLFGVAILLLLGYFVYTEVNRTRREKATLLVEEASLQFDEWKAETEQEPKATIEARLIERLDLIGEKYPRQYANQRAGMIRASMLAEQEKWAEAAAEYLRVVEGFPRGYLAPIALFNAAVSLEDAADSAAAREAYSRVVTEYPASYLAPHALFSRGRLFEAEGDLESAKADYTNLTDNHPSSGWTRLAKNRILSLQLKGR